MCLGDLVSGEQGWDGCTGDLVCKCGADVCENIGGLDHEVGDLPREYRSVANASAHCRQFKSTDSSSL
jgi:hypothetical protein